MNVTQVSKAFGARTVLDAVSFRVEPGQRLAVVGRNGEGKTTLLRILAGQMAPDAGNVSLPAGARVALHDQRPPAHTDISLGDYVAEGMRDAALAEQELARLEERMAAGESGPDVMAAYARAQTRLERAGGYGWRTWLGRVTRGLGIPDERMGDPLSVFSGGELTRASLARALAGRPDVLLLDEPTNHLDTDSAEWLEGAVCEMGVGLVVVSHDRWFLESVATGVLELEGGRAKLWPMGYSAFRRERAKALELQAQAAARSAAEIARLERFVERWRAGTKAKQAQSRQKRLDRMSRVEGPRSRRSMDFGFPTPTRTGRVVLEASGLTVAAGDTTLLEGVDLVIERGQRIALVGPNGAGKTTLVETLLGARRPAEGRVSLGHRVEPSYFSQHGFELRDDRSLADTVTAETGLTRTQARTLLGAFLFPGEAADRQVADLSGGERRRLSLAMLVARGGNLLVLDEPTNHLDAEGREALEDALNAYEGTLVVISHD
ncbi:MAG TPA: ABC-F family ATP-binding cassette domain-containing protein, partial [Miltoncostaeaceae bacterium]|nr:ABC-F family ATP-binding cassette domain-containing protein [Miltoncostaeaceae bacterium]